MVISSWDLGPTQPRQPTAGPAGRPAGPDLSGSALVVPAQAERTPGRIQQNPDVVPRLVPGGPRAQGGATAASRLHLDGEMHHRALLAVMLGEQGTVGGARVRAAGRLRRLTQD